MGQSDGNSIAQFIDAHPSLSPVPTEIGPYLIDPPILFATDQELSNFRDEIEATLLIMHPEDRYLRDLVDCFNAALIWRESLPPELQIWRTQGLLAVYNQEHDEAGSQTGPGTATGNSAES